MITLKHIVILLITLLNHQLNARTFDDSLLSSLQNTFDAESISFNKLDLSEYKNNQIEILSGSTGNQSNSNVTLIKYQGEQNFTTYNNKGNHLIYYNYNDNSDLTNGSITKYINLLTDQDSADISYITNLRAFDENCFVITGAGSLNGKDLSKQVLLNLTDLSYTELFDSSITNINAVHFLGDTVYIGGNFTYDDHHAVISYNFTKKAISPLPFGGFGDSSVVNTISNLNNDTVLFAGKFDTLDESKYLNKTVYYKYQNVTVTNETITSNHSISTNSTDQVQQLIPLNFATWKDNGDSTFKNLDSFMCPESGDKSSNWIGDNTGANFEVDFLNSITPSKIRVFMTDGSDSVSQFRLMLLNGGYLNMTYYDPFETKLKSCDNNCPLYNNISTSGTYYLNDNITSISFDTNFQDFYFSPNVPMDGLQFQTIEGISLVGIQLMQSGFAVYANNTFNNPGCSYINSHSQATLHGSGWTSEVSTSSGNSSFMQAPVESSSERSSTSVIFSPQINVIGEYSLELYTPGCLSDNTCSARGIVNVTLTYENENGETQLKSQLIYQDNNEEKYDTIYSGYLYSKPSVEVRYYQPIVVGNSDSLVMVADRLGVTPFNIPNPINYIEKNKTTNHTTNTTITKHTNVQLPINGLFEYSISNFTNNKLNDSMVVGNTSLNYYPQQTFVNNGIDDFSLFGSFYNHTLIVASGNLDGIVLLTLTENNQIESQNNLATGGNSTNALTLSNGIQLLMGNFQLNGENLSTLYYDQSDGTFSSLGSQLPQDMSVNNFNTIYENYDSYLFSFDNSVYFNWSSTERFENSSDFNLILKSSGFNKNGDTIFFGSIFNSKYSPYIEGSSYAINENMNLQALSLPNDKSSSNTNGFEYDQGVYINDSFTGYAINTGDDYSMIFVPENSTYGSTKLAPFSFKDPLKNLLFNSNNGLLSFTAGKHLYFYNLTQVETIADVTMPSNATNYDVNSMLYFEKDNSMLFCGGMYFSTDGNQCNGTCLYGISEGSWYPLEFKSEKETIQGNVTKCLLQDEDLFYVSGNFTYEKKNYNFLSLNMTTGKIVHKFGFDFEIGTVLDFTVDKSLNSVYVSTEKHPEVIYYQNYSNESKWSNVTYTENIQSYVILNSASNKRDLDSNLNVLAVGESGKASVYNSDSWQPYFQLSQTDLSKQADNIFFENKDNSESLVSKTETPLSNLLARIKHHQEKTHGVIKTGYVVLFGLAMSTVTISCIALACSVLFYYTHMRKQNKLNASSLKLDKMFEDNLESKMIRNVPPEELMKSLS
ncbi:hypothetical protein FOG50_03110 [Hanseniaspora uvarum]|nr:hypothetical protein FOG50_03110 [Hanseniaspora uvarum]